ncbi:MAG TPA: hypothetical protein VFE62_23780 [Gemmataceae bacterium]|nr:hypothetical protein [Gemmataceae bacterium]
MARWHQRLLRKLLRTPTRAMLRFLGVYSADRWRKFALDSDLIANPGYLPTPDYFQEYLNRNSDIHVESLEEIEQWLLTCTYARRESYAEKVWPISVEFECRKTGDCLDHSLWAWKKLHELGFTPLFMYGQTRLDDSVAFVKSDQPHHWVQFEHAGTEFLLESTWKDQPQLAVSLYDISSYYQPWLAIDTELRYFMFPGWIDYILDD